MIVCRTGAVARMLSAVNEVGLLLFKEALIIAPLLLCIGRLGDAGKQMVSGLLWPFRSWFLALS